MKRTGYLAVALLAGAATAALGHGGATGIVKERMDAMSAMAAAVKAIAPMMSGEADYDAVAVKQAAETIGNHAGEAMTRLFPEGSGGMPSVAKDAIWQEWGEFSDLAEQLHTFSEGLALAADNGLVGGMGGAGSMMMGGNMMGGGMMGGGMMADSTMGREELAEMPVEAAFAMLTNTCSTCHTRFRAEAK